MKKLRKWAELLYSKKTPKNIYIGLVGGVGDLVLASPSIIALKKKYPNAKLCFGVGSGIFYEIIANDPNIDQFDCPLFYWPPTKNIWKSLVRKKVALVKNLKYDLVVLLDSTDREWWKKGKHIIDVYADRCGVTLKHRRAIVHLNEKDISESENIIQYAGIKKGDPFITISPETRSGGRGKDWLYNSFLELIKRINKRFSVRIITFVSPNSKMKYPGTIVVNNAPTIRSVASVINQSSLHVGLDNGLTHIASAFETKIVCIHIGFPIEVCGVISPNSVIVSNGIFCDPRSISVDTVFKEVEKLFLPLGVISKTI